MTQWATLREQWLAWAEEPHVSRHPCAALDAFDDELRTLLTAAPFGARIEVTQIARLGESMPFDSIPTLVRGTDEPASALIDDVEDDDPDAASTLVHGARFRDEATAPLDVALQTPGGGLQIELEPAPPSDAQTAWYIPALTGSARAAAEDARQPQRLPELDTGGTVVAPAPMSPSGTIQIDPATTFGAEPPMAFAASPITAEPPPVRSGTTLIPTDGDAGSSHTAGVIEVESVAEPPPPPPRRPSKIVVAPPVDAPEAAREEASPSVIAAAYDESGEFARAALDAPTEITEGIGELEPELIESADLLESVEPPSRESPPKPPSPRPSGQMRAAESPPPPPRAEPSARAEPGPPPAPPPRAEPPVTPPRPEARASEPPSEPQRTSGLVTGQTLPPSSEPHWSSSVFGEHFFALARPGSDRIAVADVEFVLAVSGVGAGASAIDVGCGDGHHASALAERGLRVLGLEASPAQIHRASENFGPGLPNLRWLLGDVRQRPVSETFDLVTCLGTSFGHYDDGQNRVVLESLRDLCRPGGGRLVLHVLNRDYVVPRLPARSWWQGQGCLVLDEVEMQDWASRLSVRRTIVFEDGRQFEHAYALRAYALHELAALCESVGLRVLEASGSRHTRGRFFGATSPDIWLSLERR